MEHTHQKKHFSEEEALEKVERKIDHNMEKIMNKSFFHRFLSHKYIKTILGYPMVEEANHKLAPYLKILFSIVGWLSLVT